MVKTASLKQHVILMVDEMFVQKEASYQSGDYVGEERIIRCRSLVKADINFWKEDLGSDKPSLDFSALLALLSEHEIKMAEPSLDSSSEEVSTTIAGYKIGKKV